MHRGDENEVSQSSPLLTFFLYLWAVWGSAKAVTEESECVPRIYCTVEMETVVTCSLFYFLTSALRSNLRFPPSHSVLLEFLTVRHMNVSCVFK